MSGWILIVFIVEFVALGIVGIMERSLAGTLYGLGGAILNIGVLIMMEGAK